MMFAYFIWKGQWMDRAIICTVKEKREKWKGRSRWIFFSFFHCSVLLFFSFWLFCVCMLNSEKLQRVLKLINYKMYLLCFSSCYLRYPSLYMFSIWMWRCIYLSTLWDFLSFVLNGLARDSNYGIFSSSFFYNSYNTWSLSEWVCVPRTKTHTWWTLNLASRKKIAYQD